MKYPSRSEYCSAIRYPKIAFRKTDPVSKRSRDLDPLLVNGKAVERTAAFGTKAVWSASGNFAIVFKYKTPAPDKLWAVRCFYRANYNVTRHYQNALKQLKKRSCRQYFIDFKCHKEGIRVLGKCYPLLRMEWPEGDNLKKFLKANLGNKRKLQQLADLVFKLAKDLREAGVAHGDIQHGNIIVVEEKGKLALKLIDYDSLYFVEDGDTVKNAIKGLSDYQHPQRKRLEYSCLAIDYFPFLVIYLSILALAEDKVLWEIYKLDDRDGLLFCEQDFLMPDRSKIFTALSFLPPPISTLSEQLKEMCRFTNFKLIPPLDFVVSGRSMPATTQPSGWAANPTWGTKPQQPKRKKRKGTGGKSDRWRTGRKSGIAAASQAVGRTLSSLKNRRFARQPQQPPEPEIKPLPPPEVPVADQRLAWDPRPSKVKAKYQKETSDREAAIPPTSAIVKASSADNPNFQQKLTRFALNSLETCRGLVEKSSEAMREFISSRDKKP